MNIYVGNLNYRVKEDDLQKVMEDYGTVSSVKFIMDRATGRFRGIAFVEWKTAQLPPKLSPNWTAPNSSVARWW